MKINLVGRLTPDAFQHDLIEVAAGYSMLLGFVVAAGFLFYYKRWGWLWKEWLCSLDPKKIGVMYLSVAFLMLLKGFVEVMLMRAQQVVSVGDSHGFLSSDHFQQLFTAHGTTMIFFESISCYVIWRHRGINTVTVLAKISSC